MSWLNSLHTFVSDDASFAVPSRKTNMLFGEPGLPSKGMKKSGCPDKLGVDAQAEFSKPIPIHKSVIKVVEAKVFS